MRFKFKLAVQSVVLIVVALYVLHLGVSDDLNLYIHPRYIVFTVSMALISLVLLTTHFVSEREQKHDHASSRLASVPLAAVLVFALFLPARSLTSATVSQRSTDAGSLVTTSSSKPINTLFAGSSRGLKLSDWSRLLSGNNDTSYYANKPAKVSGFVYDAGLGPNTIWLARFVVTCCAVDAQPIGIPIEITDWESDYEQDQWLEVEGEFVLKETAEGEQLVLEPTKTTQIEQPSNPYAN